MHKGKWAGGGAFARIIDVEVRGREGSCAPGFRPRGARWAEARWAEAGGPGFVSCPGQLLAGDFGPVAPSRSLLPPLLALKMPPRKGSMELVGTVVCVKGKGITG